jgi:homocysteine S-methyltransferase
MQYVAFETLPRLDEIRAVRRAIHDAGITVPFWVACVFPREDDSLPDGSSIEQVVQAAIAPMDDGYVPWGIGINCTKLHKLSGLIEKFGDSVSAVITAGDSSAPPSFVLYPDGTNGEVYNTTTQVWEKPAGYNSNGDRDTVRLSLSQGCLQATSTNWMIALLGSSTGPSGE